MQAIYWLTAHVAEESPLVLTVDDAHWADPSSLRALDFLGSPDRRAPGHAPGRPSSAGAGLSHGAARRAPRGGGRPRLSLGALRPESAAVLVRDRIPEASDEICDACHAATAGNPLYLQELLRSIAADEVAPDVGTVLQASLPTLGDRVIRRVERVADDAPAMARAMAVLGNGTRLAFAAQLAAVPEPQAGRIAHRTAAHRTPRVPRIRSRSSIRSSAARFTTRSRRPNARRRTARRRTCCDAGGAPAETVAAHLRTLTPSGDASVAATLLEAAEHALERAAVDEAVGWLARALAEDAPASATGELLARLGTARAIQRDPAAIADLREAYELAEDPELRGRVAVTLAELLAHAGQWNAAIDVIESLDAELGDFGSGLTAEVAAIRGIATLNDPALIADFDRRRATYAKLARGDHWASYALAALLAVEAANRGRPDEAIAFGERALEGGRLLSERGAGAWTTPQLLGAFVEVEELERASAVADQVEAAARASGSAFALLTALAGRGWIHARRGDLIAAESDLTTVFAFARDAGLLMGITSLSFFLIDVLLEREGLSDVAELVEQTQLPADFLSTTSGAMLLEARGRLRLLRHDGTERLMTCAQPGTSSLRWTSHPRSPRGARPWRSPSRRPAATRRARWP